MNIVTLLLAFQLLLLQNISCNDNLLSKMHQNVFKIKNERGQLISYNKSAYNFYEVKAFKYNRTTTAHNVSFSLKIEAEDKIEVLVQFYKFLSNEYRHFPLRFQINFKKAMDTNTLGLNSAKNCGNTTSFYFHKDVIYHICNFVIDATRCPPLIPNGKYKIEVTFLYSNVEIALMYIFCEIYIPFEYPKNKNG